MKNKLDNAENYFSFKQYSLDKEIRDDLKILAEMNV